jgi:hypothetical protein
MYIKALKHLNLAAALAMLAAGSAGAQSFRYMGFGENNRQTLLAVRPDGSCVLTNQTTQSRKVLEMQVISWERYSQMSENGSPEDAEALIASPQPPKSGRKPLADEELAKKVREMYQQRSDSEEDAAVKLAAVEISTNNVRVVTTRSFASLKELFSQSPYTWGPTALMFEDARIELDTNHNLRITFTPNQASARYTRNTSREWKSANVKFEWKLVLPGKILSSGLPTTVGTTTSLVLDSEKPDTIDVALKLMGSPLAITAEAGGLKVDEPLESKSLVRAAWKQRKSEPNIPITDAGAGFQAETIGISLSTVHYFLEGEQYFKNHPESLSFGLSPTGTVISAKLFPPKDRTIKSVSGVRVKAAKDDKGRPIPGVSEGSGDEEESYRQFTTYSSDESENSGATRIELRLGLPAPDAKAIDELQAEAVALTIGGWKEMVLTNLQADAKKEIDLAEVLPGAKLVIKKVAGRKPQRTVEATLEGPKEVSQIELKIKLTNRQGGQSSMNERQNKTAGNKTTRNITIQALEFEMGGTAESEPLTLLVRYPHDVRRERVQFKLTALDLL